MTILQELLVPLNFDANNYTSGIDGAIAKGSAFGSFWGNIASTVVTGAFNLLGEGIQKVSGFLSSSVEEASQAQDGLAQLEAVLKSTGGAAGVTSEMAQELASSLQRVTRFSDDTIISGENMLLTFTSIGKEVFPRATQTMLDMSQALGQDIKASAIQLGKALNDPIAGVSALRRVGVQFTDEQEEMIKSMVESGDLMKAQTFILDELQKEFGGSAEAAGKTFGGQLDILKNKVSDIKERIGTALLPTLQSLTERFGNLIDSPKVQEMIDKVVTKLGETGEWIITNLPIWEEKFSTWLGNIKVWWEEKAKPALGDLKSMMDTVIPPAIEGSKIAWKGITDFWNTDVIPVGDELKRLLENVKGILELLGMNVDGNSVKWGVLSGILLLPLTMLEHLRRTLDLVRKALDLVNDILESARGKWDKVTNSVWRMVDALASLGGAMPFWLIPHSPTPLEMGLRGIDNAMSELNKKALPKLSMSLAMSGSNSQSGSSFDYTMLGRVVATEVSKMLG